jgi:hypothetical protein
VHAAEIEFDALSDAIRSGAEDEYLATVGRAHLVLFLVGGVVVRRIGFELRRARVHRLEGRQHIQLLAPCADDLLGRAELARDRGVGEPRPLDGPQGGRVHGVHAAARAERRAQAGKSRDLLDEPRVDA